MYQQMCCFLLTLLISMTSLGQNGFKNIQVDNLGYVYIIQKDKILKFDSESELKYSFSYKNSGDISSVDVTDPLKIVVFYKNFAQIIFLDNTLTITNGPISLLTKDVVNPSLVCASSDNGLWIYDLQNFTLFKCDANLQITLQIANLSSIIGGPFEPVFMMSTNSFLYMSDTSEGIFVFDQYGSLFKKMHFRNISIFDIYNNFLFYEEKSFIKRIDLMNYNESTMDLSGKNYLSATINDKFVYLLNNDGISFTKLKLTFTEK